MVSEASIAEMKGMFPNWDYAIPADVADILYKLLLSMDESMFKDFLLNFEIVGSDWGFNSYSPMVKEMLNAVLSEIVKFDISGTENLVSVLGELKSGKIDRIVIVSNHLSYGDANIIAAAFDEYINGVDMEGSLSVIAGPKVYTDPFRKFSSMHFNSLQIAQSPSVATAEAVIPVREVAKAANKVVEDIRKYVKILLVFPEGSRSRDGKMKHFLPGVFRLIDAGGQTSVLPVSIVGGNVVLPIGDSKLHRADVFLKIGKAQLVEDIKKIYTPLSTKKQEIMDYLGRMVAEVHPENMRGVYK